MFTNKTSPKATSAESANTTSQLKWWSILIVVAGIIVVSIVVVIMYLFTKNLLQQRLDERLLGVTTIASHSFDGDVVERLLKMPLEERIHTRQYKELQNRLKDIKKSTKNITFAYLLEPTEDSAVMRFIADADVVALLPSLNFNIDEVTEEGFPGSDLDVSEIYVIQNKSAFSETSIEPTLYEDYWGDLYSAFAPIKDSKGKTVAILGVDLDVTEYNYLVKTTFMPFGLLTIVLMILLVAVSQALLRMWGSRVELLRELDRQKDELISIVSHQLNTPVSAVKWNIEMFLDGDLGKMSDEQTKQLNLMQSELTNLADLVSMLLDVSRIQLGRMKVSRADLDLAAFFAEELAVIEPKAKEKKVKFTAHIPAKLPVGYLDKRLVRMTLENLLTNAVKYTPEGGQASLTVKLQGDKIIYEVKDTGCGIPKAEQARMFEKLFRASNVVNAQEGNGLGMFVAKGAVEAQGGSIRFESTEGKGSTFFVEIPLGKKPAPSTEK